MINEKNACRIFKNVLKRAAKNTYSNLKFAFFDDKNHYCCTDSYIAIRLNNPIPDIPDTPGKPIDMVKIFPASIANYKELDLPTLPEINAMIAEDRGKKTKIFTFGTSDDGTRLPACNLEYLKDVLTVFPAARAFCSGTVSPIYFASDDGDALICPVKSDGETAKTRRQPPKPEKRAENIPCYSFETLCRMYA